MIHAALIMIPWVCAFAVYGYFRVADRRQQKKSVIASFAHGMECLFSMTVVIGLAVLISLVCAGFLVAGY